MACAAALDLIASGTLADTVTFDMIPDALGANDLSPDGRYVVGITLSGEPYRLDRTTDQMLVLPPGPSEAVAVSNDGSVVLASEFPDPGTGDPVAAIWTSASGVWTGLGYLPTGLACPSRSSGYELSADGSVAVGLSWVDGCDGRGFRWTQASGMIELQGLANGANRASVCSANGNVIGGFAQGSFSRTPALWSGDGSGQLLDPPDGDALGEVHGMNDAGTIALGNWDGDAVMWDLATLERTVIGAGAILPGWTGVPMDIADNGTVVGFDYLGGNRRAWIQPEGTGPLIDLKTYIEANGGTVPPGLIVEVCQAISADGSTIIGHGFLTGAWIVTIRLPDDCPADVAPAGGDGVVDVSDLLAVLGAWGATGSVPSDATGDGVVDVSDLLLVLGAWGPCPGAAGACCTGTSCSQMTEAACLAASSVYLGGGVPCSPAACDDNDSCAGAIDITADINGPPVAGDNGTATPPFGGGDPELPSGSPSCQWNQNPVVAHSTVWYSFVAPANGSVTLEVCSSAAPLNDSTLALYSGACGSLVEVACDEDGCENPPAAPWYSRLEAVGLTPGATYHLCVMNPGDWLGSVPGPFALTVTSP